MSKRKKVKELLSTPDFIRVLTLRTLGNFLILSSLFVVARTFYYPVQQEVRYRVDAYNNKQYIVDQPKELLTLRRQLDLSESVSRARLLEELRLRDIELLQPVNTDYSIVIPKIAANVNIIPDVNASSEEEYLEALKHGVAHVRGTKNPGEGGHIFMFAHSTDYFWNVSNYNAVFFLLNKLENGDEVNIFYSGDRYTYKVYGKKVVEANEVEYLTRTSNYEFVTLQTCWPPGTTLKRLLVFAKLETDNELSSAPRFPQSMNEPIPLN